MSLTSQLKDARSPLRGWFEQTLPDLRGMQAAVRDACASTPPVLPADTAGFPWADVGTAFSYRAGLALSPPDLAHADRGGRSVLAAVEREHGLVSARRAAEVLAAFLDEHRRRCSDAGLPTARPSPADERELARDAYVIALLEVAFRVGADLRSPLVAATGSLTTDGMRQLAPDQVVGDLVELAAVVHDVLVPAVADRAPLRLGPVFSGSYVVGGGADADLIAGGLLLETKATVKPTLRRPWCYQLLGYALLDLDDDFSIDEVGFFLPRQRQLVSWPLDALVAQVAGRRGVRVDDLRASLRAFLTDRWPAGAVPADALGADPGQRHAGAAASGAEAVAAPTTSRT